MIFARTSLLATAVALGFPGIASAWTGTGPAPGTYGYTVDTSQRNDVAAFYHAVYKASEGYPARVGWTGSYATTANAHGTVATVFVEDVERRVNFFRALCGVPANARFNTGATVNIFEDDAHKPLSTTTKAAAAQRSALMIILTYQGGSAAGLNHNPNPVCPGWTEAAWNANSKGNLTYGFYGPGAVDSYFKEDIIGLSSWNTSVGHRRWLLAAASTNFATGDIPGRTTEQNGGVNGIPPTNAMYVFPKNSELATITPRYTPYPAPGYFPATFNSPYWSLSYPGATFTGSTVVRMFNGSGVELTHTDASDPWGLISVLNGFGENTVVWQVPKAVASRTVTADTNYTVTVSNYYIPGNPSPQTHTYTVKLMNPDAMSDSLALTGSASPLSSFATTYSFARPTLAEAVEVGCFKQQSATWTEGAEDATPLVIPNISSTSPALVSTLASFFDTGAKSFRLTFPTSYEPSINGVPDQSFEIDRDILTATGSTVNFRYKRGYMTSTSVLNVESSPDGGLTWTKLGSVAGLTVGSATGTTDTVFSSASYALPTTGTHRIRFRLNYTVPGSTLYTHGKFPTQATGIFIDGITVTNCNWLEKKGTINAPSPATQVSFDSAGAGETLQSGQIWHLRLRAKLGARWFPYGPSKVVVPVGPYFPSGVAAPPVAGATYLFTPVGPADSYTLEVAKIVTGTWKEGAETSPVPKVIDDTGAYALYSTKYKVTGGTRAFRLGLDSTADSLDSFTIDRNLAVTATSNLTFQKRRRRMLNTSFIHAEVSTDNGMNWTSLWNQPGLGTSTTSSTADAAFTLQTVSLAAYAGQTVRIRFAFKKATAASAIVSADTGVTSLIDSGVWIDDVTVTNSTNLAPLTLTPLPGNSTSFRFDATTAGETPVVGASYRLRVRAVNAGVPGAWGEPLIVIPTGTPLTGFAAWEAYDYPMIAGVPFDADTDGDGMPNGFEYAFFLNPLVKQVPQDVIAVDPVGGTLTLTRPLSAARAGVTYGAQWSPDLANWSSAGITVTTTGGQAKAETYLAPGSRFLRWKVIKN